MNQSSSDDHSHCLKCPFMAQFTLCLILARQFWVQKMPCYASITNAHSFARYNKDIMLLIVLIFQFPCTNWYMWRHLIDVHSRFAIGYSFITSKIVWTVILCVSYKVCELVKIHQEECHSRHAFKNMNHI